MSTRTKRSEGLSTIAAITFAVGTMIGAGVFVLSGIVVNIAGPGALVSYVACALLVSFSGLSYASLASIFPEDGGGYLFAEKMLGKYPGFLTGWIMYIAQPIVLSFVLLGFGIYLNLLLGTSLDPRIYASGALLLITALNIKGIAEAGRFEIAVVVAKVLILILLIIIGITFIQTSIFIPFMPHGVGGVVQGIAMVFFAYMGFQVVAMMGGEVKQASRNVPLAMLASILIVGLVYVGVILALLAANLPTYGNQSVFDAASVLIGPLGGTLIALGAVLSTLSSANALTAGSSRIIMEMASEKQIPGRYARLKNKQPVNALLLGAVVALAFILFGSLDFIIGLVNVAQLIAMFFVNVSAVALMRNVDKLGSGKSFFRIPLGVVLPSIGAISCILAFISIPFITIAIGLVALLLGTAIYWSEDTPEGDKEREKIASILKRLATGEDTSTIDDSSDMVDFE